MTTTTACVVFPVCVLSLRAIYLSASSLRPTSFIFCPLSPATCLLHLVSPPREEAEPPVYVVGSETGAILGRRRRKRRIPRSPHRTKASPVSASAVGFWERARRRPVFFLHAGTTGEKIMTGRCFFHPACLPACLPSCLPLPIRYCTGVWLTAIVPAEVNSSRCFVAV